MEYIWIDAVDFAERGGFLLETQFVREMGQAYLLADGVGEAVAPAATTFLVKKEGLYRIWVRTKNWCPDHAPDGLTLLVDGTPSPHVCGKMHRNGWYFEIGGEFSLLAGEHRLEVRDLNGWFGRFACVILTNDYDFLPSSERETLERQRLFCKKIKKTSTNMGHFTLAVAGGGVGGVVAAISAARLGLTVALLQDRPVLGGNGSTEANVALDGAAFRGCHETGLVFEIKCYREQHGISWSEALATFAEREPRLQVFYNTLLVGATTRRQCITKVKALHTLTLAEGTLSADYFIDATGDGWLGYYAGAAYRVGREGKMLHGESFAPPLSDDNTMSGCATRGATTSAETVCSYLAEDCGVPTPFVCPDWAFALPRGDALGRTPQRLDRGAWWLEMPGDYDDLFEAEYTRDAMLRMAVGYFDWLKNSWEERDRAACYRLKGLGTYLAKRESRRLIGPRILTENDYREGRCFADAVGYCGWNIDVHHTSGIFSGKDGKFSLNRKIPLTPIPFSVLYSKSIKNLMMTGRCISTTHIALGSTRVQLTAAILGQAVGSAAYLCKKHNKLPDGIRKEHITELQQLLIREGCYIPALQHNDPADLARSARVTATSATTDGAAENVINGKTRRGEGEPYAWISSEPLPQSITLHFAKEQSIRQVRVTLDMPLEDYSYGYLPSPSPATLLTDFTVSVLRGGDWSEVKAIRDNRQRLVVIDLPPTAAAAVRITAKRAFSTPFAVIPEIRIY